VLSLPTSKSTSDTFYTLYISHGCLIPTDGQPFFVAFLEQINLICFLKVQLLKNKFSEIGDQIQ